MVTPFCEDPTQNVPRDADGTTSDMPQPSFKVTSPSLTKNPSPFLNAAILVVFTSADLVEQTVTRSSMTALNTSSFLQNIASLLKDISRQDGICLPTLYIRRRISENLQKQFRYLASL